MPARNGLAQRTQAMAVASTSKTGNGRPLVVPTRRVTGTVCLLVAASLLAGCQERDMSDLEQYAATVLAREGGVVEPLPEIKPYEVYTYASQGKRDPFAPFVYERPKEEEQAAADNGISPDFNRVREELENNPLDALRMVGVLERDEDLWAIVRSPDGVIHRVQVGNYIGRNHGRIQSIDEDRIALVEIIPDGQGGWQEREASLSLVE